MMTETIWNGVNSNWKVPSETDKLLLLSTGVSSRSQLQRTTARSTNKQVYSWYKDLIICIKNKAPATMDVCNALVCRCSVCINQNNNYVQVRRLCYVNTSQRLPRWSEDSPRTLARIWLLQGHQKSEGQLQGTNICDI
jgi:hypothetical protein